MLCYREWQTAVRSTESGTAGREDKHRIGDAQGEDSHNGKRARNLFWPQLTERGGWEKAEGGCLTGFY